MTLPEDHVRLLDGMRRRWVIGTPDEAAAEIAELAATYGVDEVMVHPVGGAYADEPARTARSRENALSSWPARACMLECMHRLRTCSPRLLPATPVG